MIDQQRRGAGGECCGGEIVTVGVRASEAAEQRTGSDPSGVELDRCDRHGVVAVHLDAVELRLLDDLAKQTAHRRHPPLLWQPASFGDGLTRSSCMASVANVENSGPAARPPRWS